MVSEMERSRGPPADGRGAVVPIAPGSVRIAGVSPIPRVIHQDARGFLLETLRVDDRAVQGERFRMSYSSFTMPGEFRDSDRWHVHQVQTDRFVVLLGEMSLALLDGRKGSPTEGLLDVLRIAGVPAGRPTSPTPRDLTTQMVPIPPGVLHSLGNLSVEPFLYQNYPTELYDAKDEGRVPFVSTPVAALGRPFSWDLVPRGSSLE
jgi:dTDP-4-dehydrorhamnose 3,5-epimerase-like enzyme